jgi:hypothetical protein
MFESANPLHKLHQIFFARRTAVVLIAVPLALSTPFPTRAASSSIWTVVPSPPPEAGQCAGSEFRSVITTGPSSLWAVGSYDRQQPPGQSGIRTLIAHTNQG